MQVASLLHEYVWSYLHPTPSKRPDAIKLGIMVENAHLDPAKIIHPSATHPSTILHAFSAPKQTIYKTLSAKYKHTFTKTYTSHEHLLQDSAVNAVYICAPIAARHDLAVEALRAGKHVLCEAPVARSGEGVRRVHDVATEMEVVLLDGPDWEFHPATHAWRKIVDDRGYGRLLRTEAVATCTCTPLSDLAGKFDGAGGSFITLSSALSATRFALHASLPTKILSSTAQLSPRDSRVDTALTAHIIFNDPSSNPVHSKITTSLSRPWTPPLPLPLPLGLGNILPYLRPWEVPSIEVETDFAQIYFYNFTQPHVYHYIGVTDKRSGETRYHSAYGGGPLWGGRVVSTGEKGGRGGWSSSRWRLEAFVDVLQGRTPVFWVSGMESGWMGECVDGVYMEAGLGRRGDAHGDAEGDGKSGW